eukprot:IDg13691t1
MCSNLYLFGIGICRLSYLLHYALDVRLQCNTALRSDGRRGRSLQVVGISTCRGQRLRNGSVNEAMQGLQVFMRYGDCKPNIILPKTQYCRMKCTDTRTVADVNDVFSCSTDDGGQQFRVNARWNAHRDYNVNIHQCKVSTKKRHSASCNFGTNNSSILARQWEHRLQTFRPSYRIGSLGGTGKPLPEMKLRVTCHI